MKFNPIHLLALILLCIFLASCSDQNAASTFESLATSDAATPADTIMGEERVVIKTADISMQVNKVEESVQWFQTLVNQMDGHVYHYELQNQKQFSEEVKYTLDSSMRTHVVHPSGQMKVKIPVQNCDTFISAVLKMNGTINHFIFDENDITEDHTEKKELMQSDATILQENRPNVQKTKKANKVDGVYLAKELSESYIKRKSDFLASNYKIKNLWFDIHLQGKDYTSTEMTANAHTVHTPFYVSAIDALSKGWYGFSLFLTLILRLWPFLLIALVLLLAIKKGWFKRVFHIS